MRGMEKIIAARSRKLKPKLVFVWIGYGSGFSTADGFDVFIPRPSASLDLRPLVGLSVIVFAKTYSPAIGEQWGRIKQVVASGALKIDGWADADSIFIYSQGSGERPLAECVRHG